MHTGTLLKQEREVSALYPFLLVLTTRKMCTWAAWELAHLQWQIEPQFNIFQKDKHLQIILNWWCTCFQKIYRPYTDKYKRSQLWHKFKHPLFSHLISCRSRIKPFSPLILLQGSAVDACIVVMQQQQCMSGGRQWCMGGSNTFEFELSFILLKTINKTKH